jgi:hypothetical protein
LTATTLHTLSPFLDHEKWGFSFLLTEQHTQLQQVARIAAGKQMVASGRAPKPHDFLRKVPRFLKKTRYFFSKGEGKKALPAIFSFYTPIFS